MKSYIYIYREREREGGTRNIQRCEIIHYLKKATKKKESKNK